jgi:DnaJ family protein B protein 13
LKGGYRFAGNPEEIFERFFGTSNPFASLIGKKSIGNSISN